MLYYYSGCVRSQSNQFSDVRKWDQSQHAIKQRRPHTLAVNTLRMHANVRTDTYSLKLLTERIFKMQPFYAIAALPGNQFRFLRLDGARIQGWQSNSRTL